MNEDYLWDKTGEPDETIIRLEHTLGALRFKADARPLNTPAAQTPDRPAAQVVTPRRPLQFPAAIAAGVVLATMVAGLWYFSRHRQGTAGDYSTAGPTQQQSQPPSPPRVEVAGPHELATVAGPRQPDTTLPVKVSQPEPPRVSAGPPKSTRGRYERAAFTAPASGVRPPRTRGGRRLIETEGEAAKRQLMLALHIASEKLNFAQKKTQPSKAPATPDGGVRHTERMERHEKIAD